MYTFDEIHQTTTVSKIITFTKPFIKIPIVTAVAYSNDTPGVNSSLIVEIKDITTIGFSAYITNSAPSNGYFGRNVILEWSASV